MSEEYDSNDPGFLSINAACIHCDKGLNARPRPPGWTLDTVEVLPCPECYPGKSAKELVGAGIKYYERR